MHQTNLTSKHRQDAQCCPIRLRTHLKRTIKQPQRLASPTSPKGITELENDFIRATGKDFGDIRCVDNNLIPHVVKQLAQLGFEAAHVIRGKIHEQRKRIRAKLLSTGFCQALNIGAQVILLWNSKIRKLAMLLDCR